MALAADIGSLIVANVHFEPFVAGVPGGVMTPAINVQSFSYNPGDAETYDRISNKRDTWGHLLNQVRRPGQPTVSIETDTFSSEIASYLLLGTSTTLDQTGGTITDEAVTVTELDKFIKLDNHSVSAVVVQDETDTTTYTEGTDYTVDLETGAIAALSEGDISQGDVIHVDYTAAAKSGTKIQLSTQSAITAKVHAYGRDKGEDKLRHLVLEEVNLSPSGDVSILGGDGFVSFTLDGGIITPEGETSPGYFWMEG